MNSQSQKPIGDLLLELVQTNKTKASRFGVGAILILIFSAMALSILVWRIASNEAQRDELESLYVAGENISIATEERLTNLSVQLSSLSSVEPTLVCRLLSSVFYMYPELVEFSVLDENRRVIENCANPDAMGEISRPKGEIITNQISIIASLRAKTSKSAVYSPPYLDDGAAGPFSDLATPPEKNGVFFLGRISLPVALRYASTDKLNRFQHYYLLDAKTVFATAVIQGDLPDLTAMEVCLPLPPLPSRVELGLTSSLLSTFYSNSTYAWCSLVLLGIIFVSLFLLWRFQVRQLRTEQSMRARILVQRAVSESLLDALCVIDGKGKILYFNDAFEELFGFTPEETLGLTPPYPFWTKENLAIAKDFSTALQEADFHHKKYFEFEATRKDRTRFDCAVQVFPLLANDGRRLGFMVTHSNITQANRAARELRSLQQQFTRVLETMDAAVSVISLKDKKPTLLFFNSIYRESFGENANQHILLASKITNGATESDDIYDEIRHRWYSIRIKKITWIDDSEAQLLTTYDVTTQHLNREAIAKQLEKAELSSKLINMGEMASSLAHELNQPLAAVQNYATASKLLLETKRLNNEQAIEAFEKIITQTKRATQVMRRIRSFARRSEPIHTNVNAAHMVAEAFELVRPFAHEKSIRLESHIEPGIPDVVCDAILIEQVLVNLLKNALEASEKSSKREVCVNVVWRGNSLRFEVLDYGEGIDPAHCEDIFKPFYTTKRLGMGIGLNLCRSIIESHNRHLSFRENPAGGTIFFFSLPIVQ